MELCRSCGQEMPQLNSLNERMTAYKNWWWWVEQPEGWKEEIYGLGLVTLVAKSTEFYEDQGEPDRVGFLVFDIDGAGFRINCSVDSYGDINWGRNMLYPARAVVKTVTTWE